MYIDYAILLACNVQLYDRGRGFVLLYKINFVPENISLPVKEVLFTAANIVGTQSCRCIKSLLIFEAGKCRLHMQAAPRTPPSQRVFFTYGKDEYSSINGVWLRIRLLALKPEIRLIEPSHHKNLILKAPPQVLITIAQFFGTLIV